MYEAGSAKVEALPVHVGRNRHSRTHQAPHQPDDQGDHGSKNDERQPEDQNQPSRPAEVGHITQHGGSGVAVNLASEHRNIPRHLRVLLEAHTAAKRRGVSTDLALTLHHNASSECRHVAGDMSAHADAAAETSHLSHFLTGANADVVAELGTIMYTLAERNRGNRDQEKTSKQPQRKTDVSTHRTPWRAPDFGSSRKYGTDGQE